MNPEQSPFNQPENTHERSEHAVRIQKTLGRRFNQILNEFSVASVADARTEMINRVLTSAHRTFPEHYSDIEAIFTEETTKTPDNSEYVEQVSKRLADYYATRYTLADFEERLRQGNMTRGYEKINRLLLIDRHESVIELHVATVFLERPTEFRELAIEALQLLAKKIVADPSLKNEIKKISTGFSWIVYESPEFLKKLGFTIVEVNEDRKQASAEMHIETLLKQYL